MRKTITLLALLLVCVFLQTSAQERTISGKVTSSQDNLGIPGVTVVVKGTVIATSTDIDGNYKIRIPVTAKTLVYSSVGMKSKEIAVGSTDNVDLIMDPDLVKLNEVVVTALGIEKEQRSLGYATTQVSGAAISNAHEVNVVNSLAGKVAGVNVVSSAGVPGASSKINIRGIRSFTDNQPLFVVDGVPIDNQTTTSTSKDYPFNGNLEEVNYSNRAIDINPDDIESVTVLKGSAAAMQYGERGSNGAIIITTKKAKFGQKTQVSFSSSYQWDEVNNVPEEQRIYAQGSGGGITGNTPTYNTTGPGGDGIWGTGDDKRGTANSWGPTISALGLIPVNNLENFLQTGSTFTNSIAVSSGTEKNAYRLSVSQTSQTGIVPNTEFKRLNIRLTAQSQLNDKISINSTASLSEDGGLRAQNGSNLSGIMLGLLRAPASYDLRTGAGEDWEHFTGYQWSYNKAYDNPYWSVYNNTFEDHTTRLIANVALNYFPADWVKITFRPGIDTYNDDRKGIYAIGANNSTQSLGGQITQDAVYHQEIYTDLFATVSRKLSSAFAATLNIGANADQQIDNDQLSRGRNLAIPRFYNMGNASDLYADENKVRTRSDALFADINFDYSSTLFLTVSGRQEWTSTFGINKRTFFYPGVNAAFVFTELKALKSIDKVLSFGKIRVAYATSGHSPGAYSSINIYTKPFFSDGFTNGFGFPYNGTNGFGISNIIRNPDLKPEITKGPEVGIDLKLFHERATIGFTYYDAITSNVLLQRPVAFSTGSAVILDNQGEFENKGIEVELGFSPIKTKNFEWRIDATYAKNTNMVNKLAPGIDQSEIEVGFGDPGIFAKVGEPFGVIYGTSWDRDASGKLIIDPSSGLPTASATLNKIGTTLPDWTAGIRTTFTYKNLTIGGLLDIKKGGQIWNGTQARLNRIGKSLASADREHQFIIPGVLPTGEANNIPIEAIDYWQVYQGDFGATENAIQDAGWVRLREVSISYVLDKKILKHSPFASIEISASARNLWLDTDYTGVDPETSLTGAGSNYSGVDWFNMPNTKSYTVSLRGTF